MQAASRRLLARGRVKMMKRQIKAATSMQQLWRAWASWNRVLEFRLLVAGAKKLSQARVRDMTRDGRIACFTNMETTATC